MNRLNDYILGAIDAAEYSREQDTTGYSNRKTLKETDVQIFSLNMGVRSTMFMT